MQILVVQPADSGVTSWCSYTAARQPPAPPAATCGTGTPPAKVGLGGLQSVGVSSLNLDHYLHALVPLFIPDLFNMFTLGPQAK